MQNLQIKALTCLYFGVRVTRTPYMQLYEVCPPPRRCHRPRFYTHPLLSSVIKFPPRPLSQLKLAIWRFSPGCLVLSYSTITFTFTFVTNLKDLCMLTYFSVFFVSFLHLLKDAAFHRSQFSNLKFLPFNQQSLRSACE